LNNPTYPLGGLFADQSNDMSRRVKFSRRKFIQIAATAAAATPLASCLKTSRSWRFLTDEEAHTLEAICERIIPADQDPGAAWAGTANYIDIQLVGPYKRHQKSYRQGILGVDETSREKTGKAFTALSPGEQDEVLKALEKGDAPGETWKKLSSKQFFSMVVRHTMEGFYGDPRHGGNRDRVSWKMLKLPYPPIRGQYHYDLTKATRT
jgi:gluconate 2-dehydrogenase gamma chain